MRKSISKQLGLNISPLPPKAASLDKQLGFQAEIKKSENTKNFNFMAENDSFYNASGEEKNFKEYYTGSIDDVNINLTGFKVFSSEDLEYLESVKKIFEKEKSSLEGKINSIKLNQLQKAFATQAYTQRGKYVGYLWNVDKGIDVINKRIADVKIILEKKAAKIKSDAEAATEKLKAEAEAAKQAKISQLKKEISESSDPNIKKQLSDQLTGLLQEGTKGLKLNKFVLIGGAVVVGGILFYFFRNRS